MPRWQPIQLVGGSYADDALPWTHQDTINYIPVPAEKEGVRSRAILRSAPGFGLFCDLGTNAPIRGARNVEGRLFVVSGTTLFQINADGSSTNCGTIPGVQRCSLSHNQITGGNEVVISNGQGGYVYNTVAGTLVQITDEAFIGAICFESLDSYILGIEPARRFAYTSDLADATSYNSLDRYEAEGSPDLLVGQAVTHREWWLMGERTIEPFVNTGASTGTFQRSQGTVIEVGLAATHAVAVMDNSVFWLGSDGIVYRANGYTPERISTHAIEQAIRRCNMAQAFAFTFEDSGHKVFYLTFPDGQTWGYDAATGEWHRRKSHNLERWRINTLVKWRGVWVAGDYANGCLYQLDWNMQSEAGEVLERRRVTGVTHDHQNALIINGLELVMDTGRSQQGMSAPLRKLNLSGDLTDGLQGDSANYQYTITGGWTPATVSLISGALPTGLSVSSAGLVTGSRSAAGTFSWQLRATDLSGNTSVLSDTSTTQSTELVTFTTVSDAIAQSPTCSAVSGDVLAVGMGNAYVAHSLDRGATWSGAKVTGFATSISVHGAACFNGDWYVFNGETGGSAVATGSSFSFSALANAPSRVGVAAVLRGSLFAANTLPVNGLGVYKMVTKGASWTWLNFSATYAAINAMCDTGSAYLFGCADGAIWRSTDLTTFTKITTLPAAVTGLASVGGTVLATQSGGTYYRSTDHGATWDAGNSSPLVAYVSATPSMFVGGRTSTLSTSPDGLTWTQAHTTALASQYLGLPSSDGLTAVFPRQSGYATVATT